MGYLESVYGRMPVILQEVMLNAKAMELYLERYGPRFWRMAGEFEANQWLSPGELERYQEIRLQRLVKHAYENVPYYNDLMKRRRLLPDDIRSLGDLQKLPVLKKSDIKKNFESLQSRKGRLFFRKGHTSGTTGTPLDVRYDFRTCVIHHVADWRQKNWAGLIIGGAFASIQGRVIVPMEQKQEPFWRKNYINNQLFLSSFHLKESNMSSYLEILRKEKIRFLEGYPSTVYILAMYLNKYRQTLPLKAVLTSSETLFDYQRSAIEKAFCCRIFDFYGMAERTVFATECDRHEGLHLNMDYGIAEFLDDRNEPVQPGQIGRIVATSLHNYAMPLIRYQTNDACSLKNKPCSCGRGFPLMDDVTTKSESIITLPDGRLISPSVLTHPFKPLHNIVESQILQERTDELKVSIVKESGFSSDDEDKLVSAFQERLGEEINIRVEYVESIPRTGNGKFKWVVSSIRPSF